MKATWTAKVEMTGKDRTAALRKAAARMRGWGLAMPRVFPPLALDFGLGDFARTGHIEYWIANELEARYCGKFIFMFKGQSCPAHRHRMKHETFFVVRGRIVMHLGKKDLVLRAGETLPMKQKTLHGFTAATDALLLEVSLPSVRADSVFADKRLGVL